MYVACFFLQKFFGNIVHFQKITALKWTYFSNLFPRAVDKLETLHSSRSCNVKSSYFFRQHRENKEQKKKVVMQFLHPTFLLENDVFSFIFVLMDSSGTQAMSNEAGRLFEENYY